MFHIERGDSDVSVAESGNRPDYGSGPHMALFAAVVKLARQDLNDPVYSDEARAFLQGRDWASRKPGLDIDLFAECIGYGGRFDA